MKDDINDKLFPLENLLYSLETSYSFFNVHCPQTIIYTIDCFVNCLKSELVKGTYSF